MIAHSKPIALPNTNNSQLAYAEGSYTDDSNGAFNPASFTRHFLGSPISWRASSFTRLNSIDVTGKTPMDDSILNAVNVFEREGELCRNYTCCNLQLNDLHALLEHFEQVHIVVIDPTSTQPQAHIQIPFNPTVHHRHNNKKPYAYDSSDEMELDIDLDTQQLPPPPPSSRQSSVQSSPSPPDTPISTPLSNYPSPHAFIPHLPNSHHLHHHSRSPYTSQPPSPLSSTYDPTTASSTRQNSPTSSTPNLNLNLNLNLASHHGFPRATPPTNLPNPEEAFNPYARFASDYSSSMPGALFNGATVDEASALHSSTAWQVQQQQQHQQQQQQQQMQEGCVPPALLFSSGATRVPSPTHKQHHIKNNILKALSTSSLHRHHYQHRNSSPSSSQPTSPTSTTSHSISRPGSSLLLCKPFRCPKPNCNKSYKQANGLKYHMTHGSCNFAPPKDLEHVKDLLERKRREREGLGTDENGTGLTRSASLGSASPAAQHHYANQSLTTPSTPTISSPPSTSTTPATTPPPTSTPSPPSQSSSPPIKQNDRLSPSSILTYSDLSNISEHDLREVEREAERRLRPYACSVGDCQRRYKNMNGLRYHYQHSGDHGAVGLALLASGQHECLSAGRRNGASASASGSMSVPVSRGGSVSVGNSRTGTPQPLSFGGVGAVDVKPDVTALAATTAAAGGAPRNTSPTQVQAQAQAYHQRQLQQFQQQQQQQQMQMRDQQQRQQQQEQQVAQQQQQQAQHAQLAYHYAHMQRQYQVHAHAAQQQAQNQQQQTQQQISSHPSSPTHANPSSPLGHSPQMATFLPSSVSSSASPPGGGVGVSSPIVNGTKSPIPMDIELGMGLGMGMGVDMGLGSSPRSGMSSEFNSEMGLGLGFDNGMGMGSGMRSDMNMNYGLQLDMGGLHHPMSPGGRNHHHPHQTYGNQTQIHQNGNGMSS